MQKLLLLTLFSALCASTYPALSTDESDFIHALAQGLDLSSHHKYRDALRSFEFARQLSPKSWQPYFLIGDLLVTLDDAKGAIATLTQGIAVDPNHGELYFTRGKAYFGLGDTKSALSDCNRAISLEPKNVGYFRLRAHMYAERHDYQAALKDYTTAIEISAPPKSPSSGSKKAIDQRYYSVLYDRGSLYRIMGKYESAIDDYTAALAAEDDNAIRVLHDRAECYDKLGKHDLAARDRKLSSPSNQLLNDLIR